MTFEGYESEASGYALDVGGSFGANAKFSFQFVKLGADNANVKVKANIKLKFVFSPKLYISESYKYIDIRLDYNLSGSVSVTGEVVFEKPIAAFTFGIPGVSARIVPCFTFSASGSIEISGTLLKGTIGYGWYSDVGGVNLCSVPKAEAEIKTEVTVFVGLKLEPKIIIAEGLLAETSIEANAGAELTAELSGNTSDLLSSSKKHDCSDCIEGEIYGKFDISVKGKLLKNEKWSLSFKAAEVKVKISDFYWSISHGEFGFSTCPHISYKLTVTVADKNGNAIKNADVTVNGKSYTTNQNGAVSVFLPNGSYGVKAAADGYTDTQKTVVINNSKKNLKLNLEKAVVQSLSLGNSHSAVVTENGDLYMWGYNTCGQLGDGTTINRNTPIFIMGDVVSVSLGDFHSAAITKSGDLYMWGNNGNGEISDETTPNFSTPQKIMSNVVSVSLGGGHSAAITKSGDLYMWGDNRYGQLGYSSSDFDEEDVRGAICYTPQKILSNVVSVNLGNWHSAAITKTGDLFTWGYNNHGELGYGTTTGSYTPKKILSNVVSVSLGYYHSAAITKSGDLYM